MKEREEKKMITKEELKNYIEEGRHGVTKHQMIPAINNYKDNEDVIKALQKEYPNTFKTSLRYCKKGARDACIQIFGEDISKTSPEEIQLINDLKPNRKGISMNQIIGYVESAVDEGKFDKVLQVQKFFPEYYLRSVRYIKKPTLEKIRAFAVAAKSTKDSEVIAEAVTA